MPFGATPMILGLIIQPLPQDLLGGTPQPLSPTWHRLGGAAGGAEAIVIDCDDPEVIAHAWLQDVRAECVGGHLLGDVFDEDVP